MSESLTFLSWVRPEMTKLVTRMSGGRSEASTSVSLNESGADGTVLRTVTQKVPFLIAGPADVVGLLPGAILRRYPTPGAQDHESNRCPYIELADPSLPWRYTPAPTPTDASLHPWLVLIVGRERDELVLHDTKVRIEPSAQHGVQSLAAPGSPYRFAHVQDNAGQRTTRLLCGRPLDPGTDYLAVVVPAYDPAGLPHWNGSEAVTVPAYDHWRFHTAVPAGSFENLAARLVPGSAPASLGRARLHYPRVASASDLGLLGALVANGEGQPEEPLPAEVQADLAALRLPNRDAEGRPIVALPRYGEAWDSDAPEQSAWGRALNLDPRRRGTAGLGLEVAIRKQEDLIEQVLANLGALSEARQRIRHLTLGLAATRSLWRRRVPVDPTERLWLLGPAMKRLVTDDGTVDDLVTANDRTIPRGTFSAAARRVLRAGPARTRLAATRPAPVDVVAAANKPPPLPPSGIHGIPLDAGTLRELDTGRKAVVDDGAVNRAALAAAAGDLAAMAATPLRTTADELVAGIQRAVETNKPVRWAQALATLASADAGVIGRARDRTGAEAVVSRNAATVHGASGGHATDADLVEMLSALGPQRAGDPTLQEVALDSLAAGVAAAFDPSSDAAPAAVRTLATIQGEVDPVQPLAAPELCVGLDRAAWSDLAAAYPDLLLPGVGGLAEDRIVPTENNPVFIESFLAGLNTQLLTELRWRNIPVATGCTPIRRFWDRVNAASGERAEDIVGIAAWPQASGLGDVRHRPPGISGDLVLVVRAALLLRYPTTLVYLQSAVPTGGTAADFDSDPSVDGARSLPGFRGRIGADVAFFGFPGLEETALRDYWLVLQEPPAGYRFANDVDTPAATGHEWAAATLVPPVRVLIRGDALIDGGNQ